MNEILKISNLTIQVDTFNNKSQVLDNVSFSLNKGEIVGILGESGSGKSITALSILGILAKALKIKNGQIIFKGKDLLEFSDKKMNMVRGKAISMIFQEPMTSLNPVLKSGFQVGESLKENRSIPKKELKVRVLKLFEEVKLPDPLRVYNSYPHQLSGGQRQRVMIAMALAGNPEILIADEPTTALDMTVQKTIIELLKELQKTYGLSILFISHDIALISDIADRIIVMRRGKIVEMGNNKEIVNNPQHVYTRGLFACRPPIDKKPRRLLTIQDFEKDNSISIDAGNENGNNTIIKKIQKDIILRVENLQVDFLTTKIFGKEKNSNRAVDGVSFDLYKGETLGLVGESGSGKTTVGRTIMNLISNYQGVIEYKGRLIKSLSNSEQRALKKNIQLIFQDPYSSLNPKIPVGKAIMEPMEVHGIWENSKIRKDKVFELLDKVGLLPEHFNRYPNEFSGGQRQRIVIARALSMQPEVIICDESVSALDVSIQAQVLNLLNDLKEELELTYIFVSHDLGVVKYMSDRIMVLNKGIVEEINTSEELFNKPQTAYTEKLIQSIPRDPNLSHY
ncbi:MAG: ABC transporter ATP-binding protein [Bacteroidales bacterium]|nr:ABC transporter ATP-binding protein [Bacteroidales bacterium]